MSCHSRRISLSLIVLLASMTACKAEIEKTPTAHKTTSAAVAANDSTIFPAGPEGEAARRGFAILSATRDSLPHNVGNNLRCFSCHLDNGRRANGIPMTGTYARYPNYTTRDGHMISIQDRVNNCLRRSLAGRNLAIESRQMNDIVTYLALVSRGVAVGSHIPGEGLPKMPQLDGDTAQGSAIYTARCARCHGVNGEGIPPAAPLWGARSYSVGASLARVERAASFIRHNMPFDSAGVLTDQQSYDVAAYVLSHARQDSRGKENDWPMGGAPRDVPYDTRGHVAFHPPPLLPPALQ